MAHSGWAYTEMVQSSDILTLIMSRAWSTLGCSDSNAKVSRKLSVISDHVVIPLRNSVSVYQFLGTVSNVWMNLWTHSSSRMSDQFCLHVWMCALGSVSPVYFYGTYSLSTENLMAINLLVSSHDAIFSLCAYHHLAGVAHTARSIAAILCSWGICCSNCSKQSWISVRPWYDGS